MISFPIFEHLVVSKFGLYPGTPSSPGMSVKFLPGLTLVLGANGLGKTTLVWILYRILTGPSDISGLSDRSELGNIRLAPTGLGYVERSMFARRVVDGAKDATAKLVVHFGASRVEIERSLRDLSLISCSINGEAVVDETAYQERIPKLVGVWSFGDWILLLRHMVFYFEDRRALVWDPSAQRQILRFLLLPAQTAKKWTEDEREILELDSRIRNLVNALNREVRALSQNEGKVSSASDVRERLATLGKEQEKDLARRQILDDELSGLDSVRQRSRLRLLKAQQARESAVRDLERLRLLAIEANFPKASETAKFIYAQLMAEEMCLVCGSEVPALARDLAKRIDQNECVVCKSLIPPPIFDEKSFDEKVRRAIQYSEEIEADLQGSQAEHLEVQRKFDTSVREIAELDARCSNRSFEIDGLIKRLPPAEADIHRQRSELTTLKGLVESLKLTLSEQRKAFSEFVGNVSREMVSRSEEIKRSFDHYAEGFLLEHCKLVWSPQKSKIGETGEPIFFPAFELEMSGSDFPSPVRRSGPDQVSESQREFIDLAFRMALLASTAARSEGSLVIDTPEASLDAVFSKRAAGVLSRFAKSSMNNRLVVTSNLAETQLIPSLLAAASTREDRSTRVVDLLSIAEPTAALRALQAEYVAVRDSMLGAAAS